MSERYCPNCGKYDPELYVTDRCPTCGNEGAEVETQDENIPVNSKHSTKTSELYCPKCGKYDPELYVTDLCPTCGSEGTEVEPQDENLPVNSERSPFPIIDPFDKTKVNNELTDSPRSTNEDRQHLEEFHKEHQSILTSTETIIDNILSNRDKVEVMKTNEAKLLELISKKSLKLKEVMAAIDEMKPLMKEVSTIYLGSSNVERDFHITLKHFETSRDFLSKIYNEIHNGVKLITYKSIKGEEKFAEISIRDTTIYVHAFGSLIPDSQAKVIEFEDLKEAFLERSLRVFFDFTSPSGLCQRVFMDCYDHSVFTYYFLKLCTGEAGPSYLGCPLQRKGDKKEDFGFAVLVDNFQSKLDYEDKYQGRLCKNSEVFGCLEKKKQYFISFLLSGSFEVFRAETEKMYPNVIGTSDWEDTQKLLSEKSFNKVLNCGLALTLNF